jgi:PAS domain S-box-containing protein
MKRRDLLARIFWIAGFLLLFVLAFLASVVFLNPSSVGNQNFVWNLNLWAFVWALVFIFTLVLTVVLARSLIRLFFEYQHQHPGSRIRRKLVLVFITFSLFPALIMAFLALGLINQNLTTWVSAPSEQLLQSARFIARNYYTEKEAAMRAAAELLAEKVQPENPPAASRLKEWAERSGFDGFRLVDPGGRTLLEGGRRFEGEPAAQVLNEAGGGTAYHLQQQVNLQPGIVDYGLVAVPLSGRDGAPAGTLILSFTVPRSVAFHVAGVEEADRVYQGLKGTVESLRLTYFLVLTLITLAVVFGFVWLGNYIARKLTVPLEALAAGSRELAEGNLDHRVEVQTVDELAILVNSFNRMADQLRESRRSLEAANQELLRTNHSLEERRRYIETVLQNIATGVLTVDQSGVIRTANQAALKMLQASWEDLVGRPIREVTDPELYGDFQEMTKRALVYGTHRKELTIRRGRHQLFAAATLTVTHVTPEKGLEYLLVLDDLTELLRAEKFAAWQEVARRLAHEVKNPLTPIQLSVERIQRRFDRLSVSLPETDGLREFREVLTEAARIILNESKVLKTLLTEFSRFARLPICRPVPTDLHGLIEETLQRYNGTLEPVTVVRQFDPAVGPVLADPEQLQRVFVNLIDNSLVDEQDRRITIRTALNRARNSVTIEFSDNGHGIPPGDYEHLFLPYFSTKKKGTGLGLTIVRQIVGEHQGHIRAEPNEPKGTRFVMEIPRGVE